MNAAPLILLAGTGVSAFQDLRTRTVDERFFYLTATVLLIYNQFTQPQYWFSIAFPAAILCVLLYYSNKHPDKLGRGDALYIPLMALALTPLALGESIVAGALYSILYMAIKKTKDAPLVTFYWLGTLAVIAYSLLS